jgi:hypothetical protein
LPDSKEIHRSKGNPVYVATVIAGLAAISTSLIVFSDSEGELYWSNWTINATSAMAVGAGALLLLKSGSASNKTLHLVLILGLTLWLAAELLWTYYELGLGIEMPYPSAADALWLAGYGPFIYYVQKTFRTASSSLPEKKLITFFTAAVILTVVFAVFLWPIIQSAFSGSHWIELLVGISYPILDAILLTLVIMNIASLRPTHNHFIPSVMIMISMMTFIIADTGFGYGASIDLELLDEQDAIWNSLYNLGYLSIAGALYLQYRLQQKIP